ncbi:MAG: hypothetical protein PVJ40_09615 [Gammaproteobacteria bacterium]|jgi:hypothetical protein
MDNGTTRTRHTGRLLAGPLLLVVLAGLAGPAPAMAQDFLALGITDQYQKQAGGVIVLGHRFDQRRWQFELGGIAGTVNQDVAWTSIARTFRHKHWSLTFGPAVTTRITPILTGHLQFITTIGYQAGCCQFAFRHISNSGIQGANLGTNIVMLSWEL